MRRSRCEPRSPRPWASSSRPRGPRARSSRGRPPGCRSYRGRPSCACSGVAPSRDEDRRGGRAGAGGGGGGISSLDIKRSGGGIDRGEASFTGGRGAGTAGPRGRSWAARGLSLAGSSSTGIAGGSGGGAAGRRWRGPGGETREAGPESGGCGGGGAAGSGLGPRVRSRGDASAAGAAVASGGSSGVGGRGGRRAAAGFPPSVATRRAGLRRAGVASGSVSGERFFWEGTGTPIRRTGSVVRAVCARARACAILTGSRSRRAGRTIPGAGRGHFRGSARQVQPL